MLFHFLCVRQYGHCSMETVIRRSIFCTAKCCRADHRIFRSDFGWWFCYNWNTLVLFYSCLSVESCYQDLKCKVIIFKIRFVLSHSWEQPIGELSENIDFSRFRKEMMRTIPNFIVPASRSATTLTVGSISIIGDAAHSSNWYTIPTLLFNRRSQPFSKGCTWGIACTLTANECVQWFRVGSLFNESLQIHIYLFFPNSWTEFQYLVTLRFRNFSNRWAWPKRQSETESQFQGSALSECT